MCNSGKSTITIRVFYDLVIEIFIRTTYIEPLREKTFNGAISNEVSTRPHCEFVYSHKIMSVV